MKQEANRPAAVALKYDGQHAPTISATGTDELAEEIIRIAREHGIPLYENPELAGILSRLELNDEIPETLYRVVAEILAFAFNLQGKTPADAGSPGEPPL
ncbi:EscU/YscU/HrcU family type III secretion system export apparatus switch protein [Marinobacter zhejiangensis]|uniref:Flagellar biosynthetic protein FlhB n=1 Tax=Marinobacter zhejiangensis TaxID=488535 RepID=A0A1I4NQA2_9GAMM|nr:EscU/YscU/HrcU family type III secretion system export apparatus switch protein [Marinobacter zhejiangensis]SFM17712.1 flagellar biosynthesis protein [Marinobacter zhejiangensis]